MRYSIVAKGLTQSQLEDLAKKTGARNIKSTKLLRQVFCDLDMEQAEALARTPGIAVKLLKEYRAELIPPEEEALWQRGASNGGYHYLGSAKTYAPIGKAFAEAMLEIEKN